MASLNLLKNTPLIDISLYYKYIDENIFKDFRFVQLMNILMKAEYHSYKYSLYTDTFLLQTNVYLPNFHSSYLACGNHNVFIGNPEDLWLTEIFTNNNYYVLENDKDDFDYSKHNIKKLKSIREIL